MHLSDLFQSDKQVLQMPAARPQKQLYCCSYRTLKLFLSLCFKLSDFAKAKERIEKN